MDNKEYKVITANTALFANTAKLHAVLKEESAAGWELVEKLDNYKVRLVRDISARANDANCSIDPYRTDVGMNKIAYMAIAAVVTVIVIFAVIQAAALSVQQ